MLKVPQIVFGVVVPHWSLPPLGRRDSGRGFDKSLKGMKDGWGLGVQVRGEGWRPIDQPSATPLCAPLLALCSHKTSPVFWYIFNQELYVHDSETV